MKINKRREAVDDVDAVEAAEASIDAFINRRSDSQEKANALEELWRASERRHQEKRHRENAAAWREYHLHTADSLERTAAELAASHRSKAKALADQGVGEVAS